MRTKLIVAVAFIAIVGTVAGVASVVTETGTESPVETIDAAIEGETCAVTVRLDSPSRGERIGIEAGSVHTLVVDSGESTATLHGVDPNSTVVVWSAWPDQKQAVVHDRLTLVDCHVPGGESA